MRRLVGERRLIELASEAARLVGEGLPRPERLLDGQPGPLMLLTLLTYFYAAGIYSSEEIEWACEHDASARSICETTGPTAESLRRFRRANRPWVEACLAWVCAVACAAPESSAELNAYVREKLELAVMIDMATADC